MTPRDWRNELERHGILAHGAAAAASPAPSHERPWYVSALLGVAAWLASLCAFFFVALLFEPSTAAHFAILGLALLGGGFGLYAAGRANAFLDQLALALTLAGELAVVWATIDATDSAAAAAAVMTAMQVAVVLAFPNRFAKWLAAFLACAAWALTLRFTFLSEEGLIELRAAAFGPALVVWLVIWLPLAFAAHWLIANEARWMASRRRQLVRPALHGLLAALALATWFSEPVAALSFWAGAARTNWLALWPLLAAALALFAALCAFRLRDNVLIGVAIAGALLHVVQYYYLFGVTLVAKAWIMLGVGALCLGAARLLEPPQRAARPAAAESEAR